MSSTELITVAPAPSPRRIKQTTAVAIAYVAAMFMSTMDDHRPLSTGSP